MCKVVNIKDEYDIYVGRPSKWGNPYTHLNNNTRAKYIVDNINEAIEKYEEYLIKNKELFNSLHELKYKKIACWCKTKKCHAYILKKYVDELENKEKRKNLLDF